jgi:hypothetical protein
VCSAVHADLCTRLAEHTRVLESDRGVCQAQVRTQHLDSARERIHRRSEQVIEERTTLQRTLLTRQHAHTASLKRLSAQHAHLDAVLTEMKAAKHTHLQLRSSVTQTRRIVRELSQAVMVASDRGRHLERLLQDAEANA